MFADTSAAAPGAVTCIQTSRQPDQLEQEQAIDAIGAQGDSVAGAGLANDTLATTSATIELADRPAPNRRRAASDTIVVHGDSLVARLGDAADRLHDTVVLRRQVVEDRLTGSSERLSAVIRIARKTRRRPRRRGSRWANNSTPGSQFAAQ